MKLSVSCLHYHDHQYDDVRATPSWIIINTNSIMIVNIFNIIFMIITVINSGDGLVGTEEEGEKVH